MMKMRLLLMIVLTLLEASFAFATNEVKQAESNDTTKKNFQNTNDDQFKKIIDSSDQIVYQFNLNAKEGSLAKTIRYIKFSFDKTGLLSSFSIADDQKIILNKQELEMTKGDWSNYNDKESFDSKPIFKLKDVNFDGYNDILLLTNDGTAADDLDVWLYNQKTHLFEKADSLHNINVDMKKQILTESDSDGTSSIEYKFEGTKLMPQHCNFQDPNIVTDVWMVGKKKVADLLTKATVKKKSKTENKVFFYNRPESCPSNNENCKNKSNSYVIAGDEVYIGVHIFKSEFSCALFINKKGKKTVGFIMDKELSRK